MAALRTLAFLALIGVCSSEPSNCSYRGLLEHLNLATSNEALKIVRPVKNWTRTTTVHLRMHPNGILDVDEKSQTVSIHISVQMFWTNEFLTWNSSEFCGIDAITLPRSALWIPDIAILQDASDSSSVLQDPLVYVKPNGLVSANERQRLTYTCQLNLYRFPFDLQRCNVTFSSMCCDEKYIKITKVRNGTIFMNLTEELMTTEGEWTLAGMEIIEYSLVRPGSPKSVLMYSLTLERKPFLYVINLIMPLLFLLVLDLASFFIGEARGEKLGFKVTVLLSIFVLLLILKDILPSTEDQLPLMASYCVMVFTLVWVSVLEALLVSFLMDLDARCGREGESSVDDKADVQQEAVGGNESSRLEDEDGVKVEKSCPTLDDRDLLKEILEQVKAAGCRMKDQKKPGFYRRVAKVIDILFFVLYCTFIVLSQISIFSLWVFNA